MVRFWQDCRFRRSVSGRSPGRVLDVGCGDGSALVPFREAGWEAWGIETSAEGAALAGARGLNVLDQPLAGCGLPEGHFDLIMFWHSLEHMPDPLAVLKEAARLLRPDGVALIALPNAGSWEAGVFRHRWFHLDLPRHLYHFTPESLGRALRNAGFDVVRVRWNSWAYNWFGAWQSALNVLPGETNAAYKTLKGIPALASGPRALGLAVAVATAPVLLPLAAMVAFATALARHSGCIEVVARLSATGDRHGG